MFLKHSLVSYKNRPALIIDNGPDLQIELEDGRTQKVRSKDVILIHPGPLLSLAHLVAQSGDAEASLLCLDRADIRDFMHCVSQMAEDIEPGRKWRQAMSRFMGELLRHMPVFNACMEAFRAGIIWEMHREYLEGLE